MHFNSLVTFRFNVTNCSKSLAGCPKYLFVKQFCTKHILFLLKQVENRTGMQIPSERTKIAQNNVEFSAFWVDSLVF